MMLWSHHYYVAMLQLLATTGNFTLLTLQRLFQSILLSAVWLLAAGFILHEKWTGQLMDLLTEIQYIFDEETF